MKISFITSSEQELDYFPQLEETILLEMPETEIEIHYVPTCLDIPLKAKQLALDSDLVFVSHLYDKEEEKIKLLIEKIIDVELETNTPIIKAIEQTEFEEILTEEERKEEKTKIVEKKAELILNIINFPEKFNPEFEQ